MYSMGEVILRKEKFEKDIIELINRANLPAFILKPIIGEILSQISIEEQQQLELAKQHKEKREEKNE